MLHFRAAPEDIVPMKIIGKVGRQEDGTYVISKRVQFDATGKATSAKYVWDTASLQIGVGDQLPMASTTSLPLDREAGRTYFLKLMEMVEKRTFLDMVMVAGKSKSSSATCFPFFIISK